MSLSEREQGRSKRDSLALDAETVRRRIGDRRFALMGLWMREVVGAFDGAFAPYVSADTVLLDAGCSRGDPDLPSLRRTRQTVGCDLDLAGLRGNRIERDRVCTSLDTLPFVDGAFDVVVSKFVVEHLADPLRVFREFARVLRPGGIVALLTPSRYSVFALISRCIPERVKAVCKAHLFGGYEEDTFPTHYRANTARRLTGLMADAGFETVRVAPLGGMWTFFSFWPLLARLVRQCERLQLKVRWMRGLSTYIIGTWRKMEPAREWA